MIRFVTDKDINGWLELAREVGPLFGDMAASEDFKSGIKSCIRGASALCVTEGDNIEGIIAFNKEGNEISWLAVRQTSRAKGYGQELLKAALACLDANMPIFVQTFSAGIKIGEAARKLYTRFGFEDYKHAGANPAGIDTVIMRKEASGEQAVGDGFHAAPRE